MKTKFRRHFARVMIMALVLCMMVSFAAPVFAAEANQEVTDAKNGVVQIQMWFYDPDNWRQAIYLGYGTGFLINENTVITNEHVINHKTDSEVAALWRDYIYQATQGLWYTPAEIMEHIEMRVTVLRDVYVKASIRTASTEMDYAILTLDDQLYNRSTLKLRSSATLRQTESVYALGFPGDIDDLTDQSTYDADDVTITTGAVNKVDRFTFESAQALPSGQTWIREYTNVDCVESSAKIAGGNSGGPLVDANGAVVGINAAGSDSRNLAVASDQLIATLDALGIEYDMVDGSAAPDPTEAPTEAPAPATEPVVEATEAPVSVTEPSVAATEAPATEPVVVDNASDSGITTILLIAAAVAVVVVVVVVIVAVSGKGKKNTAAPTPVSSSASSGASARSTGFTAVNPTPSYGTAPMPDAGETSVLSQDAGETTVLSKNVNGGTLVRKRNGETVKINAETFVIGRERKTANYCISDNSSISRTHVKLTVRDGVTYLSDMNTANGTFVNGSRVMPRQEIALKNGDKITLADEDLEYKI